MTPNMNEGVGLTGEMGDPAPVGDLLDYLRRQYEALDDETKQELFASLSLPDAVQATVQLAFPGRRIYLAKPDTSLDNPETRDAATVIVWCLDDLPGFIDPYDPTRLRGDRRGVLGRILVRSSLSYWRNSTNEDRDYLIYRALREARVELHTITDVLANRDDTVLFYSRPTIAAIATMWRDALLDEGYTPEASRTLLALRAAPAVLALTEWDDAEPIRHIPGSVRP